MIEIKDLGIQDYLDSYQAMLALNAQCQATDQIWLLEHNPVYTLGLAACTTHLLNCNEIPVVKTDRGGQVTYHGIGQLIAYLLIDLNKRPYFIKQMVYLIEQAIIDYLQEYDIIAERRHKAPGVYIQGEKIAALGLRVRKGRTYHGLALNVDMDIEPFNGINPCGHVGMKCTQLKKFVGDISMDVVKYGLSTNLLKQLDVSKPMTNTLASTGLNNVSG